MSSDVVTANDFRKGMVVGAGITAAAVAAKLAKPAAKRVYAKAKSLKK
jgi:hypothetical protein